MLTAEECRSILYSEGYYDLTDVLEHCDKVIRKACFEGEVHEVIKVDNLPPAKRFALLTKLRAKGYCVEPCGPDKFMVNWR